GGERERQHEDARDRATARRECFRYVQGHTSVVCAGARAMTMACDARMTSPPWAPLLEGTLSAGRSESGRHHCGHTGVNRRWAEAGILAPDASLAAHSSRAPPAPRHPPPPPPAPPLHPSLP